MNGLMQKWLCAGLPVAVLCIAAAALGADVSSPAQSKLSSSGYEMNGGLIGAIGSVK